MGNSDRKLEQCAGKSRGRRPPGEVAARLHDPARVTSPALEAYASRSSCTWIGLEVNSHLPRTCDLSTPMIPSGDDHHLRPPLMYSAQLNPARTRLKSLSCHLHSFQSSMMNVWLVESSSANELLSFPAYIRVLPLFAPLSHPLPLHSWTPFQGVPCPAS